MNLHPKTKQRTSDPHLSTEPTGGGRGSTAPRRAVRGLGAEGTAELPADAAAAWPDRVDGADGVDGVDGADGHRYRLDPRLPTTIKIIDV